MTSPITPRASTTSRFTAAAKTFVIDQSNFAAGYSDEWAERFPQRLSQPVALYVEGFLRAGSVEGKPGLTFTIGLRMEHNSDPALPHQLRLQLLAGFQLPAFLTSNSV